MIVGPAVGRGGNVMLSLYEVIVEEKGNVMLSLYAYLVALAFQVLIATKCM